MPVTAASNEIVRASSARSSTDRRQARLNALRLRAVCKQRVEHSHAPRPGSVRLTAAPLAVATQRNSCADDAVVRHPIQVRIGE